MIWVSWFNLPWLRCSWGLRLRLLTREAGLTKASYSVVVAGVCDPGCRRVQPAS